MRKIVINALPYKKQSSGIGVMIYELFGKLVQQGKKNTLVLLSNDSPPFPSRKKNYEEYRIPYRKNETIKRNLYQSLWMGMKFCKESVFVTTDSKIPFFMPKSAKIVLIVTDLAVYRMPQVYQWSRVVYWKLLYRCMKRRVTKYVAISDCTKQDLIELLDISPEKIEVIPCAAPGSMQRVMDPGQLQSIRNRYHLPKKYILFVGNFNPRKNLERSIMAFDAFKEQTGFPHKLVIAGEYGWKFDQNSIIKQLKHPQEIIFAGYVKDLDLPAVYSMSGLFVFPTLYEGFGIPILEAQACGVPVLAGNNSAMPEVGGNAAQYVDVTSVSEIAKAISRILQDDRLCQDMVEKGYKNASKFSWEASVKQLNTLLDSFD